MPTTTINLTGQALSKVDDTNVTLTLGGTPLTALLKATSLTLGWTGTLADARITSAATWNAKESALTFSTGLTRTVNTITIDNTVVTLTGAQALSNKTGLISQWTNDSSYITSSALTPYLTIVSAAATYQPIGTYATASNAMAFTNKSGNISQWTNDSGYLTSLSGAVTSVSGTASRITSTGGSTPVIDISASYVGQSSITTVGTIGTGTWQGTVVAKTYGGTGVNIASAALLLGTASTTAGQLTFSNATNAFTQTIRGTNPVASITYDLPTTAPTAGQVLSSTAPAAGIATLSWATASGGLTVGTTTITSGTSLRIPYNLAGVYQEQANFTIGSVASGYLDVPTGYALGGSKLIKYNESGIGGLSFGIGADPTGGGFYYHNLAIGINAVASAGNSGIAIGYGSTTTAASQLVIGSSGDPISSVYIGSGVTAASPSAITYNSTGGSGTNIAGAAFTIAGGKGTGTGAGGNIIFQTSTTLGSGTTLQSLVSRLTISGGAVTTDASTATWCDAINFVFGSTTGTKFGTATSQKLSFWNATPIVQLTTAVGSATLASPGAGTNIKTDDTFDGYTLQQIVKALRNLGILA